MPHNDFEAIDVLDEFVRLRARSPTLREQLTIERGSVIGRAIPVPRNLASPTFEIEPWISNN